jgi:hypothetical protein
MPGPGLAATAHAPLGSAGCSIGLTPVSPPRRAQTWGRANLQRGDEVVLSVMEHHSNIVPWQLLAEERGGLHGHPTHCS